jgi:Domain of unknown function (DUF5916)
MTAACIALAALGMAFGARAADLSVDASSAAFVPNALLTFDALRCNTPVHTDGKLDEPIWQSAKRVSNFCEVEPGDNTKPPVKTEAMFAYDDDNLYVAFICYDNDPGAIRASVADRDNMYQDDWVGFIVDTFDDQQNGYFFVVNPRGIQGDLFRSRNNEDASYDAVWSSGGQITDFGWTAEMAIPFRSIRFPSRPTQAWGLHVFRTRPRASREQYSWEPISRDGNCFFCQEGTLAGIEGIHQGHNLEILPYVIGSQSGGLSGSNDSDFNWNNDAATGDAGVGVKYGITANHTLDFTYNPDFSQIEADATQIDANQTFALFYQEKRPFFLEGADRFQSSINVVYTRSINDPIAAAKYTGKSGANTISFMSAKDENSPYIVPFEEQSGGALSGNTYSNILRYKRDMLKESFVGVIATDRRAPDNASSNTTAGIDTRIHLNEHFTWWGQVQGSYTREPNDTTLSDGFNDVTFGTHDEHTGAFDGESYAGYGLRTEVVRSARHFNADLAYEDFSPTFRAENGFITANNYRLATWWSDYMFNLDSNPVIDRIEPQIALGRKYNHANEFKDTWIEPQIWLRFKKQTSIWTDYVWSKERFAGTLVDGIARTSGDVETHFSRGLQGGFTWRIGHSVVRDRDNPRLGNEHTYTAWADIRPTSQFLLSLEYSSFHLTELGTEVEIAKTYVTRARLTYQFSKQLFFRVVGEYVDDTRSMSLDPLLSYKINPFTVFFIGSSHSFDRFADDPATTPIEIAHDGYRQTERLFFVKFQYLIRM